MSYTRRHEGIFAFEDDELSEGEDNYSDNDATSDLEADARLLRNNRFSTNSLPGYEDEEIASSQELTPLSRPPRSKKPQDASANPTYASSSVAAVAAPNAGFNAGSVVAPNAGSNKNTARVSTPQQDQDQEETISLISDDTLDTPPQKRSSWSTFLKIAKHPFVWSIALATALTNAANTLLSYPDHTLENRGELKTWWHEQTIIKQADISINVLLAYSINTIMTAHFFPLAAKGVYDGFINFRQTPISVAIGVPGALLTGPAAFSLSYSSFENFFPAGAAISLAAGSALTNMVQRFVGINDLYRQTTDHFKLASKLQRDFNSKLNLLSDAHFAELKQIIIDAHRDYGDIVEEAPEQFISLLTERIATLLDTLVQNSQDYTDVFEEETKCSSRMGWATFSLRMAFATFIAIYADLVFTEKTAQGISSFEKISPSHTDHFDKLAAPLKILIASVPGLVSAIFYFTNVFALPNTLMHAFKETKDAYHEGKTGEFIKNLAKLAFVLGVTYPGSKSMLGAALGVLSNTHHLFHGFFILLGASLVFARTCQIGGGAVNLNAITKYMFPHRPPILGLNDRLETLADVAHYISKLTAYLEDVTNRPIGKKEVSAITKLSLFSRFADLEDRMDPAALLERDPMNPARARASVSISMPTHQTQTQQTISHFSM